jgi:hypothetical protein
MPRPQRDEPTPERIKRSEGFFIIGGDRRAGRRFTMRDDPLGRALVRQIISDEEYYSLKKYALHWFAGGLGGHLGSVDLNRVLAFDPGSMSGLAKSEAQADHRRLYQAARLQIGTRPAFVADQVACFETALHRVGHLLGYHSPFHAREKATEILRDAGGRLATFWKSQ